MSGFEKRNSLPLNFHFEKKFSIKTMIKLVRYEEKDQNKILLH